MARGQKPQITHEELVDGIFKAMMKAKVKHMPTQVQFYKIKKIKLCTGKTVTGKQLYHRATNYGLVEIREELRIMSKTEHIRSVEKRVHDRRPVL